MLKQLTDKNSTILQIGTGNSIVLSKQYQSYQTAKIALQSLFGNEHIAVFDELNLEFLLGNLTEDVKEYFLKKTILSLSQKEQELLKAYFTANMSLKETCKQQGRLKQKKKKEI